MEGELSSRVVVLPDGLDPFDFLQQRGLDAFREAIEKAPGGLDFRVAAAKAGNGTLSQARAVDDAVDLIARMPNPVTRSLALGRLAESLNVPQGAVQQRLDRALSRSRRPAFPVQDAPAVPRRDPEEELVLVMLNYPDTVPWVREHMNLEALRRNDVHQVVEVLYALVDQGMEIDASEVLARIHDDVPRSLVGRLIEKTFEDADPLVWCGQLVHCLRGREAREEAGRIRRTLAEEVPAGDSEEELLKRFLERKREGHEKPQIEKSVRPLDPAALERVHHAAEVDEEEIEY
jgi:DNA primase